MMCKPGLKLGSRVARRGDHNVNISWVTYSTFKPTKVTFSNTPTAYSYRQRYVSATGSLRRAQFCCCCRCSSAATFSKSNVDSRPCISTTTGERGEATSIDVNSHSLQASEVEEPLARIHPLHPALLVVASFVVERAQGKVVQSIFRTQSPLLQPHGVNE